MAPNPIARTAEAVIFETVAKGVDDRLRWNEVAYGKAWTGEYGDSEFIAGSSIGVDVIEALEAEGWTIASTREQP